MKTSENLPLESVDCPQCSAREAAPEARGFDYEYATSPQEFTLVRCAQCALVRLDPRPATAALGTIYPPHYYAFTGEEAGRALVRALRERWERAKVRDYARWLGPGPRRVLDVGCGTGRLLSHFDASGAHEWDLWGIDLDPHAVEQACARGFRAELATIESWQTDARFDLILMQQVIEHVANPRATLLKLAQLLTPGGVLVLETPDLAGWDRALFGGRLWGGYHFPRHWTLFDRASLRRMVESAGLEVVQQRALASLSFWTWSIHHWLLTRRAPGALVRWCRPPNGILLALTAPLEILQLALGRRTSNQRLVARCGAASSPQGVASSPQGVTGA